MLDDNLPTYRLLPSPKDPHDNFAYFSHNGSDPTAAYLLKRPPPATSRGTYALGLLDAQSPWLVYAEVLVRPEWSQPTLSAAELRASSTPPPPPPSSSSSSSSSTAVPLVPETFKVELCNPDLVVGVRLRPASWNKAEAWEFDVPEMSFKMPSASRIDRDDDASPVAALAPRVCFRWKRDSRLTRDMTCYMCGRSVAGKKSKEPDITIAMFRAAKNQGALTIYEPNLARVDVQDRKGLELVLLLGSVAIRDLYLAHRNDPFNLAGPGGNGPYASGALTSRPMASIPPPRPLPDRNADERQRRDEEEQRRIQRMLAEEEAQDRRRRDAEVERETERLRRQYGVAPCHHDARDGTPPMMPGGGGWHHGPGPGPGPGPAPPPRPNSVEHRRKFSNPLNYLMHGAYGGAAGGMATWT
ncbi:hypothetical protein GQ602_001723 [Ophiocordyceps camponoti-floridani]|uniref:Uncharacterized protein n=1 Tax=Ophiocordyceps camponoti-floridani TaxID=2030778 RepID=A0A8H4Q918_9HYPO|nr:hypothetical protein GQ602_001723 [Ophiocordyceps camponoti-floridani]